MRNLNKLFWLMAFLPAPVFGQTIAPSPQFNAVTLNTLSVTGTSSFGGALLIPNGGSYPYFNLNGQNSYEFGWDAFTVAGNMPLRFSGNLTNALSTADTGLSRGAAGVIDVGNGLAGDTSGTISAARANISFGTGNTSVGNGALPTTSAGGSNTAYGFNALTSNTAGNFNTANGQSALFSNTTGSSNTANGLNALYSNTAGNFNTASGMGALFDYNDTTSGVDSNSAFGYNTGRGLVSGVNNTILGANVAGLAAGLSDSIILATGEGTVRADFGKTTANTWTFTGTLNAPLLRTSGYTVATLPAGAVGDRAYVTDQLTTCATAGAALTGGGSVVCPVFHNATTWVGD